MFFNETSGNVSLAICEEGCGHIVIGGVEMKFAQTEMDDLIYLFRNAIEDIVGKTVFEEMKQQIASPQRSLTLIRD